jgi:hypothetical protein
MDFINCSGGCAQIWSNANQVTDPLTIVAWYGASLVEGFALVPSAAESVGASAYSGWLDFELEFPGATTDIIQQLSVPPSLPVTLPGLAVGLLSIA